LSRRKFRPRSTLTGVHDNLADILGEESLQQLVGIARLKRAWPNIVGSMMATRTEPIQIEHLKGDALCLWIAVDHSIMAQQIRFLRNDIRKACYKHAHITNLHHIRSRVQPGAGIKPKPIAAKPARLSLTQKRVLALEVASIKNRTLRQAAFHARMTQVMYAETEKTQQNNQE